MVDAILSLNATGRGLILPQLNVPDFVDSHGSPYSLRGVDGELTEGRGGEVVGGVRGRTEVGM